MFDMSWGELMLIGGVALIAIPPKDLPKALRTFGQMTTKVRRLASEFQGQLNEAIREAELDGVRKDLETVSRDVRSAVTPGFNPIQTIRNELKGAVEQPTATPPARAAADETAPPLVPSSPELAVADTASAGAETATHGSDGTVSSASNLDAAPAERPEQAQTAAPPVPHRAPAPFEITGPGLESDLVAGPGRGAEPPSVDRSAGTSRVADARLTEARTTDPHA